MMLEDARLTHQESPVLLFGGFFRLSRIFLDWFRSRDDDN